MKKLHGLAGALILLGVSVSSTVSAQTLVYCSEGSPEGFDPALYTSGTTFDASSRQIYNKLVEFTPGTTSIAPALAESWEISDDGLEYTFSLRKGVKFHATDYFTPSRDMNADDVIYSFERQRLEDHPYHGVSAAHGNTSVVCPCQISSVQSKKSTITQSSLYLIVQKHR